MIYKTKGHMSQAATWKRKQLKLLESYKRSWKRTDNAALKKRRRGQITMMERQLGIIGRGRFFN